MLPLTSVELCLWIPLSQLQNHFIASLLPNFYFKRAAKLSITGLEYQERERTINLHQTSKFTFRLANFKHSTYKPGIWIVWQMAHTYIAIFHLVTTQGALNCFSFTHSLSHIHIHTHTHQWWSGLVSCPRTLWHMTGTAGNRTTSYWF